MASRAWAARMAAALIAAASTSPLTPRQAGADDPGHRIGVVHVDAQSILRLTIDNDSVPSGSRIAIVTTPDHVVLCCAVVDRVLVPPAEEFDPVMFDQEERKTSYVLDPAGIGPDVNFAFGIVGVPSDLLSGGPLPTDIDGDGTMDRFRSCASGEGLHLTVWNGEPLAATRVWHAYFYLGYDTKADCAERDYE